MYETYTTITINKIMESQLQEEGNNLTIIVKVKMIVTIS